MTYVHCSMLDELTSDGTNAKLGQPRRAKKKSTDADSAIIIGARVRVMGKGKGTVRYIGVLHTSTTGEPKVGVELDRPSGKNDGSLGSHTAETVQYFPLMASKGGGSGSVQARSKHGPRTVSAFGMYPHTHTHTHARARALAHPLSPSPTRYPFMH